MVRVCATPAGAKAPPTWVKVTTCPATVAFQVPPPMLINPPAVRPAALLTSKPAGYVTTTLPRFGMVCGVVKVMVWVGVAPATNNNGVMLAAVMALLAMIMLAGTAESLSIAVTEPARKVVMS